jgi:hypothetical protein
MATFSSSPRHATQRLRGNFTVSRYRNRVSTQYLSFVGKIAGLVLALNVIPFVDPQVAQF